MKHWSVMMVAGLVLAGCEGGKLEAANKRLAAAEAAQRELDQKTQALSGEVDTLRKRLRELDGLREAEERKLETLQDALAESWHGDPNTLSQRMEATDVPEALRPALQKAQERKGSVAAERLFQQGVEQNDLDTVAGALDTWEVRTGFTALAEAEEEAPAPTCEGERAEVTFSCVPLPLEGPKDEVTQLCRMSRADSVWVLRSDAGALARVNLVGSHHDRYRPVRMFSPELWALAGEDDDRTSPSPGSPSAKAWLEVFKLTGASERSLQGVRRHALPLEKQGQPVALVELDLDSDGAAELLTLDGKEVRALRYDARHEEVNLWTESDVCPRIEKRTEKELEPARAPCTAWVQAQAPKDAGPP